MIQMQTPIQSKSRLKLSDQVRRAVTCCDLTQHRISQETGISEPLISRFISGKNGLSMAYLDKLADFMGIDITVGGPAGAEQPQSA